MYHQNPSYNQYDTHSSMSTSGIQGQVLEVTVVGCNKLKDTEWISRQDPYVCVEYGSNRSRTRTCTDGGKNPIFQEKFVYTLIEGLRELNVVVWNSNTVKYDDLIGSGKVPLQKVLSTGFDDSTWPIQSKSGRHSGEVRLIMHYSNANSQKPSKHSLSAPPYGASHTPTASMYSAPPPAAAPYGHPAPAAHYPPASAYPPTSAYPSYPPSSAPYPPNPYGAPSAYPPQPYGAPSAYPPQPYPPQPYGAPSAYPPQAYPPGPYPGAYPPPPY